MLSVAGAEIIIQDQAVSELPQASHARAPNMVGKFCARFRPREDRQARQNPWGLPNSALSTASTLVLTVLLV
jgi:hypothetical protein